MAGGIYAAFVQRFIVTPNEQDKEQPFIVHNIAATRRAYALDRVEERELSGDAELTAEGHHRQRRRRSRTSGSGITSRCCRRSRRSRKSGRTTTSSNVDNDRYMIDGKYRQVMLSARELNTESMQNRSWVNERLTFTHGYGLTLGPVNQVTTEGLPVLFIRDLPPVSTVDLRVDRAEHLLRRAVEQLRARQDAASRSSTIRKGDDNETTYYEGTGGVPIGSVPAPADVRDPLRATPTSWSRTSSTPESRILFHRRIADRVQHARAVPDVRRRSVSGRQRRPALLDSGRVHDDGELSVLDADDRARAATSTTSATR